MKLSIPELSLVVLVGASGCGKSTFARRHFKPTEIISSDHCRALVSDDETNQEATRDAFELVHFIAGKRLGAGRLTVIDATSVQVESRKPLLELARRFHVLPVAIVFNLREDLCQERNRQRTDRQVEPHVIRQQHQNLRRSLRDLEREGFRYVHVLNSPEEVEAAQPERTRLWTNLRDEHGPFDIIGDIHGCHDELVALLEKLGYVTLAKDGNYAHPEGRKAIFVGDLVDRGPKTPDVLRTVMMMVNGGTAFCVVGNHDDKLKRKLRGRDVRIAHGLAQSLEQLQQQPPEFSEQCAAFIDKLVSHYVLNDGRLIVAHAGLREELQGRSSARVRDFAMYGETTGETDEYGLPVRYNWAAEYRGKAMVVYGHTPVPEAEWLNNTICIDTGCVFGGSLTALRYPERELVSVPAAQAYYESVKPLFAKAETTALSAQQQFDDVLDLDDVTGKRVVSTRLHGNITIREENAIAALEVMSRFAANPKWLIYLPPTMSPSATSQQPGLLEHPAEAFAYFASEGVERVVCEEKHMGSRAIVIVCRNEEAVRKHFGITGEGIGIVYTRTGRKFFDEATLEAMFLERVRAAIEAANLWQELETDWMCLDCELMPWSAKAQELLRQQYAATGAAAQGSLPQAVSALQQTAARGVDVSELLARFSERAENVTRYVEAYRRYCWPVNSLEDFRLAPFHLLATEGKVHADKDHTWHMQRLARICHADEQLLMATPYRIVNVTDEAGQQEGIAWWTELTERGGEGMVVKPFDFVVKHGRTLVQPAVKCRGREYLRIIYGPEYTATENLERLRSRGLGRKRSLALREFALGIESLERFVRREPLRRVHECAFGVLALESEPVDPRL